MDGLNLNSSQRRYSTESWKNTEYFLRKFSNLASVHDANLIVIIFPYQDQIEGRSDFNEQVKLKQILDRNQIEYFDPSVVLTKNKRSGADASNLYHDNTHPNKLGTSVIANAFSSYLLERYAGR